MISYSHAHNPNHDILGGDTYVDNIKKNVVSLIWLAMMLSVTIGIETSISFAMMVSTTESLPYQLTVAHYGCCGNVRACATWAKPQGTWTTKGGMLLEKTQKKPLFSGWLV